MDFARIIILTSKNVSSYRDTQRVAKRLLTSAALVFLTGIVTLCFFFNLMIDAMRAAEVMMMALSTDLAKRPYISIRTMAIR
jgi:hypothetical protein